MFCCGGREEHVRYFTWAKRSLGALRSSSLVTLFISSTLARQRCHGAQLHGQAFPLEKEASLSPPLANRYKLSGLCGNLLSCCFGLLTFCGVLTPGSHLPETLAFFSVSHLALECHLSHWLPTQSTLPAAAETSSFTLSLFPK